MLSVLDLSPVFAGVRSPGDLLALRPLLYGRVPPAQFLIKSVDTVRASDPTELSNQLLPVSWLTGPRDAISEGGMTTEVAQMLRNALTRCLQCSLSPRERLQIWYCLRSLGVTPDDIESKRLLGVIVEFPQDSGLSLLTLYSDRFSATFWEGGSARWPAYEEGAPTLLVEAILKEAARFGMQGEVVEELPEPLPVGHILVSYLYPSGIRVNRLSFSSILSLPQLDLYNGAVSLFSMLSGGGAPVADPPMDLDDPQWEFPLLKSRIAAIVADLVLYTGLLFAILFSARHVIFEWDPLWQGMLVFFVMLLPPFVAAWMESSPVWGYKTVGKGLFGLVVYSASNSAGPTFLQALARNCAKWFISPLFLFCGFFWAFFHRYQRTWHDLLSHTVVLQNQEVDDEEELANSTLPETPTRQGG